VKVLLDTHAWLWGQGARRRLSIRALELLEDPDVERLLSLASAWEIAIKYAAGKLALPDPPGATSLRDWPSATRIPWQWS